MTLAGQGALSIGDLFGAAAVLTDSGQVAAAIALYHRWIAHTNTPRATTPAPKPPCAAPLPAMPTSSRRA